MRGKPPQQTKEAPSVDFVQDRTSQLVSSQNRCLE